MKPNRPHLGEVALHHDEAHRTGLHGDGGLDDSPIVVVYFGEFFGAVAGGPFADEGECGLGCGAAALMYAARPVDERDLDDVLGTRIKLVDRQSVGELRLADTPEF